MAAVEHKSLAALACWTRLLNGKRSLR